MRSGWNYTDDLAIIALAVFIWLCALGTIIMVVMAMAGMNGDYEPGNCRWATPQ